MTLNRISHFIRYYLTKTFHPGMMKHGGIELCNVCNLSCSDCPTPKSRVPKGFATDETVRLALQYAVPGQIFSFHRMGEPLLHPRLVTFVEWASSIGLRPLVSTNGLLLDQELLQSLLKAGLKTLFITLHTKKSAESFKMAAEHLLNNKDIARHFILQGNLLSVNELFNKWAEELSFSTDHMKFVKQIETHTWAGNVEGKKIAFDAHTVRHRMKNCYFMKNSLLSVRWDGTVVSCCFDSENVNAIGNIRDFVGLRHKIQSYNLCRYCDSNWAIQDSK